MCISIAGADMKGEKRIKAIERDIGRRFVGIAFNNLLALKRKEISRKEFNTVVNHTLRFNSTDADQILNVLISNGKLKATRRRIKIPRM